MEHPLFPVPAMQMMISKTPKNFCPRSSRPNHIPRYNSFRPSVPVTTTVVQIEEPSTDCSIPLFLSGNGLLSTLLGGTGSLGLGLDLGGLSTVVLAHGGHDAGLFLGLNDSDGVRKRLGWTGLALGVGAAHDLDLDT